MEAELLESKIVGFLKEQLNLRDVQFDRDMALVTTGVVDSMDIVRLAAYLERTLGIRVPDQDIHVDNFDSIARILAYFEARLGG
jgi:acyl carrier protein